MSSRCTWYNSAKAAAPTDPIAFFTWFFTQQQGWGLSMYEQDWMVTEYDEVQALQENITMGDLWLKGYAPLASADPCMCRAPRQRPVRWLRLAWLDGCVV